MKRFTETNKWHDPWFRKLSPQMKCLWMYLCDQCDCSGVIDFDPEAASFHIGYSIAYSDIEVFGGRTEVLPSGKLRIVRFLEFQYGTVDERCPAHKPVIRRIAENGFQYPINNLSDRVLNRAKEKEEEKDKEKDGEKGVGKRGMSADPNFEQFWNSVPHKIGRGAAEKAWRSAVKTTCPETILGGVQKFIDYEHERRRIKKGEYTPLHPATWLNQGRWADELQINGHANGTKETW